MIAYLVGSVKIKIGEPVILGEHLVKDCASKSGWIWPVSLSKYLLPEPLGFKNQYHKGDDSANYPIIGALHPGFL